MSLSVKHLNADTTFLLTFTPTFTPAHCRFKSPGSFTILIDPWLSGHSSVWNPKFQISHHTKPPCVSSLADIPEPDLIIISQDKPDHCHKETLCTLPSDSTVNILATRAAARKIRSWRHFKCANLREMTPFNEKRDATIRRLPIDPFPTVGTPGEVTIAYMPEKMDMTGLHNAIGITYRPPGASFTYQQGVQMSLPLTPPVSPGQSPAGDTPSIRSFTQQPGSLARCDSPQNTGSSSPSQHGERTISMLYTPHGVAPSAVDPYLKHHLSRISALPLTALFHAVNVERNPWFLGGLVASGYPGGLDVLKRVGAKYWISAHDEVKDNKGWSTCLLQSRVYSLDEVQSMLDEEMGHEGDAGDRKAGEATTGTRTVVMDLDVGEEIRLC